MSVKLESGSTSSNSFKLDGLEYQRGIYEPIYAGKESDGSGGIDTTNVRIGLRHTNTREILQSPLVYSSWVDGTDTPYASLDALIQDLASKVFKTASGGSGAWGSITGNIEDQTDLINLLSSSIGSQPVENEYADVASLLADQGNQTETFFQYVLDASADPNVASGDAYYEKLAGSTGTLATDYRLLSDSEVQIITDSNGYRVFRIQYIQDDAAPNNTASGGRIGFNYDTGTDKVTSVVFNKLYSDAIQRFYDNRATLDYKLKFYNRNTKQYEFAEVTGWTQNGNYFIVDVADTIDRTNLSVNNRVELFFEIDEKGTGGSAANTAGKTIYVNTTDGTAGVRALVEGDIYSSLNDAVDSLFADVSAGAGWMIEITDDETYTLTTDYSASSVRHLNVYSKFRPIVNQQSAIHFGNGTCVINMTEPYITAGINNGGEWNFEYTNNANNLNVKLNRINNLIFKVYKSNVTDGVGLTYTPFCAIYNNNRGTIVDVENVDLDSVGTFLGGAAGINTIRFGTYIDRDATNTVFHQINSVNATDVIEIGTYNNQSTASKRFVGGTGAPDDYGGTYRIGNITSPNGKVLLGYAGTITARYSVIEFTGGVLENTYFNSGSSQNKLYIYKGYGASPAKIELSYTSATNTYPIKVNNYWDLLNEPTDVQFLTEFHNLDIRVTGGANVGHDIVYHSWGNTNRVPRSLFNNVNIYLEDGVNVNIHRIQASWDATQRLVAIEIVGGAVYRVNSGQYLFNVVTGLDITDWELVRISGNALHLNGDGTLTNSTAFELIDSDPMKDIHLGDVEYRAYTSARPDDGDPLNMAWFDADGILQKSAIPGSLGLSVNSNGVSLDPDVNNINFEGNRATITSVGAGSVNIKIDDYSYETVSSIPSWLLPDASKAIGSVELTAGASGSVDGITVNGVQIMDGAEAFDTTLDQTAINIASNINNFNSTPNYFAYATGSTVFIVSALVDETYNGYAVVSTTTTITSTDTNMSGAIEVTQGIATVIDNQDTTYDVLVTDTYASIPISIAGAVADLEYFDVGIDGTAVVTWSGFDQSYVGKNICIKKAYQNPDTATGSEIPNTVLGRLVTLKTTIVSVVDGVSATLATAPSETDAAARAYVYTNNTEAFYRASRLAYYRNISKVTADSSGIYGFDLRSQGIYAALTDGIQLLPTVGAIDISSSSGKFKCCNEGDNSSLHFFYTIAGDGHNDITISLPILPADEFSQNPQLAEKGILEVNSANNSRRTITIINQGWNPDDVDGNDAFWNHVVNSDSTGGSYDTTNERQSQIFKVEDCGVRCKNGGYGIFQNDTYSNEVHFKDVFFNDIQHYTGENGRAFQSDNTLDGMEWQYNTGNFTVASNVVTTTDTDFSWYDHAPGTVSVTVTINGQSATIASITDAKTAVLNAGISDIASQNCTINVTNRTFWNHPMYVHPSMIVSMVRCKSNPTGSGNIKMYSESGSVDSSLGRWDIIDCNEGLYRLETRDGGTTSTETVTHISNSKVHFYTISGYCTVKNSEIIEDSIFIGHSFISLGGNSYSMNDGCQVNDDNLKFISIGERGDLPLEFVGSNVEVFIDGHWLEDNDALPSVNNGTLILSNIITPPGNLQGAWSAGDLTANTDLIIRNYRNESYDDNFSMFTNVGFTTPNLDIRGSRFYSNFRENSPFFNVANTHKNVGCIEVIPEQNNYYVKRMRPNFNKWDAYNEIEFVIANLMDSNMFIIEDFDFPMFIASFERTADITNAAIDTGATTDGQTYLFNRLPMFRGTFKTIFRGSCTTNPYQHLNGAGTNNSSLRENCTMSNMVVQNVDRVDGEVVEWYIDSSRGRIIEINSSIKKHFASAKPTRLGVENEKVYLDDNSGIYWENQMTFADVSTDSYAGTQTDVAETDASGVTTQTNTHIDLTATPEFSIFQEKTDGSDLIAFDFELNISGGGTLTFEYETDFEGNIPATILNHPDYTRNLWRFKGTNNAYQCFMNNRTGQIVFNGTISETLDTAAIITINTGYEITDRTWVRKNENGVEQVTTAQRTAILSECANGYQVYDTDTSTLYTKIGGSWV